jgi:prepilin-type N-terminal cleavage/methylation domain-containing protein
MPHVAHNAPAKFVSWRGRFTLIELLMVLVLIAIFAALALPGLDGVFKRHRVNVAVSEIINAMQYAHAEAIMTRGIMVLNINNNNTSCVGPPLADTQKSSTWTWDDNNNCDINVFRVDENGNNKTPVLKTISASVFTGLTVQVAFNSGVPGNLIAYGPYGFPCVGGGAGGCVNNNGNARVIYVWANSAGVTAATSPYASTICLGMGGNIEVSPSYINPTDALSSSNACQASSP